MKTLSTLLILGCAQVLSANYYHSGNGYGQDNRGYYNSGYQDGQGYQGYQGEGYYQGQGNQGQSYYQGQGNQGGCQSGQCQGYSQRADQSNYSQAERNSNDSSRNNQRQYSNTSQVNTSDWDRNNNMNNNDYSNKNNQSATSDEEINRKVKDALGAGWLTRGYPAVNSDVRMGIVTLNGTVDTIQNKNKADEVVRKIDGVRGVNNQITVDANYNANKTNSYNDVRNNDVRNNDVRNTENKYPQDSAATAEDRVLNAKIRDKLNSGWFSKGFDTIVLRTSNGIVVLSGAVDKNEDVEKVQEQVKNVDGVRSVNNQLTVKNK